MRASYAGRVFACIAIAAACSEADVPYSERSGAGQVLIPEQEPNPDLASATPIVGTNVVMIGNVSPSGDYDLYSFEGAAGDRVWIATMTSFSASGIQDSILTLLRADGATVVEEDDDNGSFGVLGSAIAGATLPATETYYVRVGHFDATAQIRPYHLHVQRRSGAPAAETEPNDVTPQPLAGGWVAGATDSTTDVDLYAIDLAAGDSVFISLDLDPERDGTEWNGTVGLGPFAGSFIHAADPGDSVAGSPDAEAAFFTVKTGGTYQIRVATQSLATTFGTYELNASVHPAASAAGCVTYANDTDVAIPTGPAGPITSQITVPDDLVVGDLDVSLQIAHAAPADLDVHLVAPGGARIGLFTDSGSATFPNIDVTLDEEAATPLGAPITALNDLVVQTEPPYRLHWLDGARALGTWTLTVFDDLAGSAGTIQSWSLTICPAPAACPEGTVEDPIFATDFEADDAGFTHAGTADEWARGLPSAPPIATCNSGTGCFKTDLAGTYDAGSNQELVSPPISLAGVSGPVHVRWAQKHQLETATNDHAWVEVRLAGGGGARRLFEHLDGTMTDSIGNPATAVQQAAGWGVHTHDVSEYAGGDVQLVFHLDSNATTQLGGLAIDDVSVFTCRTIACGNGFVEPGEVCDDGNTTPGDGCNATCTSDETCGNGVLDPGEVCDDGNTTPGDGCNATCASDETCGNGVVDPGEVCDDGNTTDGDGCSATCASDETCGNGVLDPGEICDDGNTTDGDGCSATCASDETCGNGVVDPGEICDDGNTTSGDGCDAACASDETCGNGVLDPGEICDDGNTTSGDGCDAACASDETCGNGVVDPGEVCDDGNTTSGDGCESDCTITPDPAECGDGTVDAGEACDDGNTTDGDGCESDCTITPDPAECGDGTVDAGEVCDDGNTTSGDGCDATCTSDETCGNGVLDVGEDCDDGNVVSGDGCNDGCVTESAASAGCGCAVAGSTDRAPGLAAAVLLGLAVVALARRRLRVGTGLESARAAFGAYLSFRRTRR
jgi:MYXO-CTERM domain-containing protein